MSPNKAFEENDPQIKIQKLAFSFDVLLIIVIF